jgi:hypothetical protein
MTLARELADTAGRPQVDKNLLINGGMNVWQRSTSTSVSTDTYSTVDRFKTRVGAMGAFTVSRSTDVPSAQGFSYSTKWDCTTADASPAAGDFIIFEQRMEGQNLQHLLKGTSSAKALTLSFWVKSNKTGTYIVEMRDIDNARTISKSYTIDSASTWEKKTITFDGDTSGVFDNDNNASLYLQMWLGAGSTYSSGTLNTSWSSDTSANRAVGQVNLADSTSNELYITGVQLEVGEAATDFQFEPYQTTDLKCRRYYDKRTGEHEGCRNYSNGGLITHVYCTCGSWRTNPSTTYYDTVGGGTWVTYLNSPYSFLATNGGVGVLKKAKIIIDAEL